MSGRMRTAKGGCSFVLYVPSVRNAELGQGKGVQVTVAKSRNVAFGSGISSRAAAPHQPLYRCIDLWATENDSDSCGCT